ncbi:MAG TPA: LLM class F420-dependent oxidoreductase, partial [Chloroflexota bacterium]
MKVGVQLHAQHTTWPEYRMAWLRADALGVDSIWTWDHLLPVSGEQHGANFEGWTLLAALAAETRHAFVGPLVACMSFRNPRLLSLMAKTLDHVLGGRLVLGLGGGWHQAEYDEFGYAFGTPGERLRELERGIECIKERWQVDQPRPIHGTVPILVGGSGERVTLRIAAAHADIWSGFGPVAEWQRKADVLDDWCRKLGRDPSHIARAVSVNREDFDDADEFVRAGAMHLIYRCAAPFDLAPVEELLDWRN